MTRKRDIIWEVAYREKYDRPYIPSKGHATSASDLYRAVRIHTTGHDGWNSCYVDPETCAAVARVVEGEVRGFRDLEAAELGLQALLWHDRADVLVPGLKAEFGPGHAMYQRAVDSRSQLAFDLFSEVSARDQIFATELVKVEDRMVTASTLSGSALLGRTLDDVLENLLDVSEVQRAALSAIPFEMSVPAYLVDGRLSGEAGSPTFFSDLYDSMAGGWEAATAVVPSSVFAVHLPPLLAVVLDRAANRSSIPDAIKELREQTEPIRVEMLALAEVVRSARDQRAIEEQYQEAMESFEAIVPASRYSDPPVVLPLLRLYQVAKSPLDYLVKALSPQWRPDDPRVLANRTVTGQILSGLLATDSMHSLVSHFFTQAELRNLERSGER